MRNYIILFLLFSTNFIFAQSTFLTEFATKWRSATDYTQKIMDTMPKKQYGFKPSKQEMSFEEQLVHMANNMNWLGSNFLTDTPAPFTDMVEVKGKSRKEIVAILNKSLKYIQNISETFDEKRLDEKVEFQSQLLTKRQIFSLLSDHHTHHRAQLLVYLRIKGETPPKYVGW